MSTQVKLGKVAFTLKGNYDPFTTYNKLDVVTYNGCSWGCRENSLINVPPAYNSTKWQLLANKGTAEWKELTQEEKENLIAEIGGNLETYILPVNEEGWFFGDGDGNVLVSITDEGLDAYKVTEHFKALFADNSVYATKVELADIEGKVTIIEATVKEIKETITPIGNDFFAVVDEQNNIAFKVDEDGIDSDKLSPHFESLIKDIDGLGVDAVKDELKKYATTEYVDNNFAFLYELEDTANETNSNVSKVAERVNKLEADSTVVNLELSNLKDQHKETNEDSFTITDEESNVVFKVSNDGLDTDKLTEHFKGLIKEIDGIGGDESKDLKIQVSKFSNKLAYLEETNDDGLFIVDDNGNINAMFTKEGFINNNKPLDYEVLDSISD